MEGGIVREWVDAIVNVANESLMAASVDGAIHRSAGIALRTVALQSSDELDFTKIQYVCFNAVTLNAYSAAYKALTAQL
ncbi:MAG: hypothetical protein ACKVSF_09125 [Alphaproteobacteria bacterium]